MIKIWASVCIEAPADIVWAQLAKLEDVQLWADAVLYCAETLSNASTSITRPNGSSRE